MLDSKQQIEEMSDSNLAKLMVEMKYTDVMDKVFEIFSLTCINLCQPEYKNFDTLIKKYNKSKTIKNLTNIITFLRSVKNPEKVNTDLIKSIKNYIEQNYSKTFSATDLADKLHFSRYYLTHYFKNETGKTIFEYKKEIMLSKAKEMLISSDKSIAEISFECGFNTSTYFSKLFKRELMVTPSQYRTIMKKESYKQNALFKYADDKDVIFYNMIPHISLLQNIDIEALSEPAPFVEHFQVSSPDDKYSFLHEPAVIVFKNQIFAAWYNCSKVELKGVTPIRFTKSNDEGKTWSAPKVVASYISGKILFCPPVFGIEDGKLYMFLNQMVKADCIHSLELYVYNELSEEFDFLWSKPIPFKLNTNVYTLPNGKLMLPGRCGNLDNLPETPAVLISDNGKIDSEWRLVKVSENEYLVDGSKQIYPETSLIINKNKLYLFSRNDARKIPLVYISEDMGETWSKAHSHDIPIPATKAYSGTLSDGRNYIIGNLYYGRKRLAMFVSEPETMNFTKAFVINHSKNEKLGFGEQWHYPIAYEENGKLYIIQTVTVDEKENTRGAVLSVVDLSKI